MLTLLSAPANGVISHTTVLPDIRHPKGYMDLRVEHIAGLVVGMTGARDASRLTGEDVARLVGGPAAVMMLQIGLHDRLRAAETSKVFHPALAAALAFLAPRLSDALPQMASIGRLLTIMAEGLRIDDVRRVEHFANGVEEVITEARRITGDSVLDNVCQGLTLALCDLARGASHSGNGAGGWLVQVARQRELMESRGEVQAPRAV